MDLLVVDLDEATADQMILRCIVLCYCYDLAESTRNYALRLFALVASHHRVRLAATSLTIRENGAVVAVEHVVDQGKSALLVDETLGTVRGEYVVI